jgi:arginyl-tRNA synthetase
MALLSERGHLTDRDGALWLNSTELGEAKDNVLVRSDGRPTYFASDIAYHYEKFLKRGFSLVIDVWGADHHGHVSRMKAAARAAGGDPDALHILLYQLVNLKRAGEAVRFSKRGGQIVTIEELVEEVGADAARFFFLQRSPGAQMDFDLDLAARQSSENPVYYVQYAHARLCSILDRAREDGLLPDDGDVRLLTQAHELSLIREIMRLPEVIEYAAQRLETQEVPQYAMELASAFTAFNDAPRQRNDQSLRVISDDRALSAARLRLVLATRIALARVLGLMGMSAPERM